MRRAADKADPADPVPRFAYAKYILDHAHRLEFDQYSYVQEALDIVKQLSTGPKAYPPAQLMRADLLIHGLPVQDSAKPILLQPDNEGAFRLYSLAAKAGIPEAAYAAAQMIQSRRIPWGGDTKTESLRLLNLAAQQNHSGALFALARPLLSSSDPRKVEKAISYLRLAAQHATKQHPDPLFALAKIYQTGLALISLPPDPISALNLLLDAADLKHAPSQHLLGEAYRIPNPSLGISEPNLPLSIHYLSLAAKQTFPPALLSLSRLYQSGIEGVLPQDEAESYLLARKAADKGLPAAQLAVGKFVEQSICVRCVDPEREAAMWYRRALQGGCKQAAEALKLVEGSPRKD